MAQKTSAPTIRVVSAEEMRRLRLESSIRAASMTQEEALAQMRRNGSEPTPNPWYNPEETRPGGLVMLPRAGE